MSTYFYVRVPEDDPNPAWRVKHADETVQTFGAFFKCPRGIYVAELDGTYEVRYLGSSMASTVRRVLTDHEGLIVVSEWEKEDSLGDFLTELDN